MDTRARWIDSLEGRSYSTKMRSLRLAPDSGPASFTWLSLVVSMVGAATLLSFPKRAEAQYRNYTFGFEAGYLYLGEDTQLKPHNAAFGLFGAYKSSDHWWFQAGASLSFPGQLDNSPNTVVLLHVVPISFRYYFQTDAFRPYLGLTNSFQFLFNQTTDHTVLWGPGATVGVEFRLKRDLFLGLEADGFWLLVFQGPDAPLATLTTQLIFFF